MCAPQDFICRYRSPAEGGFGSLASVFPRRLRWWAEPSGPRQTEITPSLWSRAHEGIVTLQQQEEVEDKQPTRALKLHYCAWLIYHNTHLFPFGRG